jgi:iron complex outermembrane recepter protein
MRLFLLGIAFIFFNAIGLAQSNSIRGSLLSAENEALAFASVILSSAEDSSLFKASTSDIKGAFTLSGIQDGAYFLSVSSVGYERFDSDVLTIEGADLSLHAYTLATSSVALEGVTIRSERPLIEVMPDKTVFNVENAGGTAGLTGFELLRRAPGVIIDNNNNLIVEGKSGVQIWIDGKPSILQGDDLIQYLRSIQASDISAIEIITQPSSKYDAQGTGGIINIKLKRDKRYGTNGSVSAGTAYGRYWKYNSSLALNNRGKKTNVYANYSNRFDESFNEMHFDQRILDYSYKEQSNSVRAGAPHNLKAGFDFYASPKSTIGVVGTGNISNGTNNNISQTDIVPFGSNTADAILQAESNDKWDQDNLFLNVNYRYEDTLGYSLNIDLDYGFNENKRESFQPNYYYNGDLSQLQYSSIYKMVTPLRIDLVSGKFDFEMSLLKGKLGMGMKAVEVKTSNSFGFFQEVDGVMTFQPNKSNDFDYKERVTAGYVNYAYKKNKWNFQAGVRIENTHSLGVLTSVVDIDNRKVEREYLNWFPSAGITYQLNELNSFALNYSRRIDRPNYESLNPFEYRLNELGFRKGNPFLQPNYTDNIKLSHTYSYKLTTSFSYSYVQDFYAQVTDTIDFQTTFIQQRNVADEEILSLSVSYPFNLTEWWSVYMNATGYRAEYTSTDPKFNPITQSTFSFYGQNSFKLPKGWNFEVSGWYSSKNVWGGTFVTKGLGSLDLAVNRKFFDDQLNASLSFSDVLYTSPWRARGEFNNLPMTGGGSWESRQLRMNLTYNFGNPELKASRNRKTGSEEEIKRID